MWVAIQPNGERIRIEHWAVQLYFLGHLTDPLICGPIRNAVELYRDR